MENTNYYQDELNKIQIDKGSNPRIKITSFSNEGQTKWLALNEESATILLKWIKENFINKLKSSEPKTAMEFVEKYYPNYSSSEDIARLNDPDKIPHDPDMIEEGDHAYRLLQSEYGNKPMASQIGHDHDELLLQVYEKAIEGFMNNH